LAFKQRASDHHIAGHGWIRASVEIRVACDLLVVLGLEIEPHLGWPSEIAFEAQGGIHGEATLTLDDFVDNARR
jgi:hypothetical protein